MLPSAHDLAGSLSARIPIRRKLGIDIDFCGDYIQRPSLGLLIDLTHIFAE
jgi:hypothetical protein